MRGRIARTDGLIESTTDDLAANRHDGPHWHFPRLERELRLREGGFHQRFVVHDDGRAYSRLCHPSPLLIVQIICLNFTSVLCSAIKGARRVPSWRAPQYIGSRP